MRNVKQVDSITVALHWLVGFSFIAVFGIGLYMVEMPAPEKYELYGIHKSLGALFFVVAVSRVAWRIKKGALESVSNVPRWQEEIARGVHVTLMLATIAMPLSGIVMNIGGGRALEVFGYTVLAAGDKVEWMSAVGSSVHHLAINLILITLALHILGALKRQFINRDGTISRMLGQ
ncbi:cytochrome b [Vibrio crassostreae]|uniref:cytochrome b n=1 Tax=Vibrio crassostreae TaxID=246167 RepID=UPI001B316C8D|nr:cytochrome b [Vibrio crassostreae]